jgi:hypothetical protein
MNFSLGDQKSIGKALQTLVPEIRGDANIMLMGAAGAGAGGFGEIMGMISSLPGVGKALSKAQGAISKAQGAISKGQGALSHAGSAGGLFSQSPSQFLSGISRFNPQMQKAMGLVGALSSGNAGGAAMGLLGLVHKEFSMAKNATGAIAKLFHAPWAQLGPGVFTELMHIKKTFPNDRLIDLKKKGYQPKFAPGFWGQVASRGTVDLMKTVPQNEHWFWSHNWKKNGMSTPSHRTHAFAVWDAMMKG